MSSLSVVVPVYNMAEHIQTLWVSILNSGIIKIVDEVIFINDGSSDNTAGAVEALRPQPGGEKVKLITLPTNVGRFRARLEGARAAIAETILFIDARVQLKDGFASALSDSLEHGNFIQPQPVIDVSRNWFCLYWDRSHRSIFKRHYLAMENGPLDLTPTNYDQYLKGTTVLIAPRGLFIEASESFNAVEVLSDDTLVMRRMVESQPLRLDPSLQFLWVPRESLASFLVRLVDRGPGLVEYHVFVRRGWIFTAILIGLILLSALIILSLVSPSLAGLLLLNLLLLVSLSGLVMAESVSEWLRLMPLHFAVVFAVGLGVLKGLFINARRWFNGEFRNFTD